MKLSLNTFVPGRAFGSTFSSLSIRSLVSVNLFAASLLGAGNVMAVDYNDAYWNNPNQNSDFVDQFDGASLNRSNWDVITHTSVNGEDEDYQDVEYPAADWTIRTGIADAGASDGKALSLRARYMDGVIQGHYAGNGKPLFIRSGRIESKLADNTTFTYGKFEARLKMPPARNAEFPAWWLLGNFDDVGWTACQELDIIEFTGHSPDVAPQTHWTAPYAAYGGNPIDRTYTSLGLDPSSQYVTYGVIKTPENVEFYINGVKTYSWGINDRGDMPWPYVSPMHMILNHAITHTEWPAVGNYNALSTDPNVPNRTGWTTVVNGVTEYEYIDTASMAANIGRNGTDFLVDYVAHWPLPSTDPLQKYTDDTKYSFFRATNNTKGFYSLRGWMAPVAVTADAYLNDSVTADRDNGPKNAADGYVGSKWATPADDNMHWLQIDYGMDKLIKYFAIEWSWNLPSTYDIYGKTSTGNWEYILSSDQLAVGWATHVFDINKTYRYIKLVTKGRISKSDPIWLLEFKAFEDVADVYPKPTSVRQSTRSVNTISNGDFSAGLNGWGGENYDGSGAAYSVEAGAAKITAATQGANNGSYQLHTSGFGLRKDYRYKLNFTARAAVSRDIKVRVSSDDLNPGAQDIYLLQTLTLTTGMTPYSYTFDFTASDNPGRLSFLFGGMGSDTVYIDDVSIQELQYIGTGEQLVPAIDASSFVAASSGWETEWWGVASRAVDGATANKASSTNGFEGQDQWVTVKIDPNYEIKQVLIAGDKSTPRSLAQFKVEYGNGTTMIDWTNSNIDGAYEAFNTLVSNPPAGEQNFKFWFRPPPGELVEVADAMLMGVDLKPYRIYATILDNGGSISPSGVIRYSKNNTDNATYTFTPPPGGSVANVIVDGVSMGALNSYTFSNISQSHNLAVSFSLTAGGSSAAASSTSSNSSTAVSSSSSSSVASSIASSSTVSSAPSSAVSSSSASSSSSSPASLVSGWAFATASTEMQPANNAIDGDGGTRWESAHNVSPSWIALDLGGLFDLSSVVIDWEAASAADYTLDCSVDGTNWTTIKSFTGGTFGTRTDTNTVSATCQHIRVYATQRSPGNNWGYSIFEFKVYGVPNVPASSSSSSIASSAASSSSVSSSVSSSTASSSSAVSSSATSSSVVSSVVSSAAVSSSVASSSVVSSAISSVTASSVMSSVTSSAVSSTAVSSTSSVVSSTAASTVASSTASSTAPGSVASSRSSSSIAATASSTPGGVTVSSIASSSIAVSSAANSSLPPLSQGGNEVPQSSSSEAPATQSSSSSVAVSSSAAVSSAVATASSAGEVIVTGKKSASGGSTNIGWLMLIGLMCFMLSALSRKKKE